MKDREDVEGDSTESVDDKGCDEGEDGPHTEGESEDLVAAANILHDRIKGNDDADGNEGMNDQG